jgi:hypothetical protein
MLKLLGRILLALLISLAIGLVIGTVLRMRLERPVEYIGRAAPQPPAPTTVAWARA